MGYVLQETRAHALRFFAAPLNVLCVAVVVACGVVFVAFKPYDPSRILTDWAAASESFRWATAVAVLFAFGWSSSVVGEDRDSGRLETLIPSGLAAGRYLIGKIASTVAVAFAPAIVLFVCLSFYRLATVGTFDPVPYVIAAVVLYLPPVVFATCSGFLAGLSSGLRMPAMIAFVLFWSVCFLGALFLPSSFQAFDITGNSLYEAFFVAPLDASSINAGGISASTLQQVASYDNERRFFQSFDLAFLLTASVVFATIALIWLRRCWQKDAAPLVAGQVYGHTLFSLEVPVPLLELKVAKSWKILIVAVPLVLAAPFLGSSVGDARSTAIFMLESATPLAASLLFAGVYAIDGALGMSQTALSLSRFRTPYVRRLLLISVSMAIVLCIEVAQWNRPLDAGFLELFTVGMVPMLFMGASAFVLGMVFKNEAATCAFLAGSWAALQLPAVQRAFADSGLYWLFPFPASAGGLAMAPSWLYVLVAAILIFIGFRLLGNPEKLSD